MDEQGEKAIGVIADELYRAQLQIATLTRAISSVVGSLHSYGLVDGRKVARSIRLDDAGEEELRLALADLIDRTVERRETEGEASPRPIG